MDLILLLLAAGCLFMGILGSVLPVLPGPGLSWVGLLLMYLTKTIETNWWVLSITFAIVVLITVLDYVIPSYGTKKYGGTKWGVFGTTVGLIVGLLAPIPFGVIIGPFLGAFVGELIGKATPSKALKAAWGSFMGFLASTFIQFVITAVYLGIFIKVVWDYKEQLF
ncbi:hypothetical protein SAMN05216480_101524 [Pustulibacterium marinum]|uniref:DUF456 domain-containing protein n=1 Tax=Pustulibacterium marinum TaxID=1224947 RepID=A0A1I7F171_9FLAO|nr:DUF456 domain-containing protein [Pustulibacterium marinum]SFU29904.1 hypothetical protein SAMN05216480_101524 [Pustulibacterium marinum]